MKHSYNFIDLTGVKINRLTFLRYVETDHRGNAIWRVRCDCGVEFNTRSSAIKYGNTRSCGCLRFKKNKQTI